MSRTMKLALACFAVLVAECNTADANLILNHSFENNTASTTMFNMSNATLTAVVDNVAGFGTAQETDLTLNAGNGCFGDAQDGTWFLSAHTQLGGVFDAFSIELSAPLTVGQTYDLSFWVTGRETKTTSVDVGVSTSPVLVGTSVLASTAYTAAIDSWTQLSTSFVASTAATHLTVRSGTVLDSIASVDNFVLTEGGQPPPVVPEPSSLILLGMGALGLFGYGLRKKRKNMIE